MNDKSAESKAIAQTAVVRGGYAREILSNPLFKEIFIKLKGDLLNRFRSSELNDEGERSNIWREFRNLENIEKHLNKVLTDGALGTKTLSQMDKMKNVTGIKT